MVILVGIALSVCQIISIHLSVSSFVSFPLLGSALSDWYDVSYGLICLIWVHCISDLWRCFISYVCLSGNNWVSFITELNCHIIYHTSCHIELNHGFLGCQEPVFFGGSRLTTVFFFTLTMASMFSCCYGNHIRDCCP